MHLYALAVLALTASAVSAREGSLEQNGISGVIENSLHGAGIRHTGGGVDAAPGETQTEFVGPCIEYAHACRAAFATAGPNGGPLPDTELSISCSPLPEAFAYPLVGLCRPRHGEAIEVPGYVGAPTARAPPSSDKTQCQAFSAHCSALAHADVDCATPAYLCSQTVADQPSYGVCLCDRRSTLSGLVSFQGFSYPGHAASKPGDGHLAKAAAATGTASTTTAAPTATAAPKPASRATSGAGSLRDLAFASLIVSLKIACVGVFLVL
ncbi:hypothetical protein CXG81DRAFT_17947 [Caulochytrium protostelioides]|uniref:Uncharacterized protein n=1 Tax=Caulochytrium protostelioides TaxID=1555241 RepID=A0A4P9XAM4_9FUNG|nr:hypothetical protein CXG81DRAFT_17947 [Caulochytrium protostelioides]|eukprot:RKP02424.1 hypothetical protein CXG81DRAFT_17947 [Caulochytrium protostelioides]